MNVWASNKKHAVFPDISWGNNGDISNIQFLQADGFPIFFCYYFFTCH